MSGIELGGLRRSYTLRSRSLTDFRAREILLASLMRKSQRKSRGRPGGRGVGRGGLWEDWAVQDENIFKSNDYQFSPYLILISLVSICSVS